MVDKTSNGYSSSSDEEEDANWKAAIESIASTTTFGSKLFGGLANASKTAAAADAQDDEDHAHDPPKLKHYQIKAQKLLDQMLEKKLEISKDANNIPNSDVVANEGGVRLFKKSPHGIIFDQKDEIEQGRKRPRIIPGQNVDEDTKKFKQQLRSVAVDGMDIIAAAKSANQKSLARLEAKRAAAEEKAKKEAERVAELKRIRGEKWLPSMEREMKINKNPK